MMMDSWLNQAKRMVVNNVKAMQKGIWEEMSLKKPRTNANSF